MKLYTYDPAPNPKRLQYFLDYKGIKLDTQQVDLMTLQQQEPEFRSVNPLCTVPTLVLDSGQILTEVIGMCVYLEALHPEKPLLGSSDLERAEIISWDHQLFLTVFAPIADMLRNGNPNFADRALPGPLKLPQIPALVERGKMRLEAIWPALDKRMENREWIASDNFSLADIDLLCATEFAGWVQQSVPETCTHLHSWMARARAQLA